MVPRQRKALGLGCMFMVQGGSLASALGNTPQYSRQKSCTIKACVTGNLDRGYRNIYILSESKAAIKALDNYQINSKLLWDCHQPLVKLAKHNRVQIIWVPGHECTKSNETADQLAKLGSECPFIGPEQACAISAGIAQKAVRDWTETIKKTWKGIPTRTLCQMNQRTVKTETSYGG
jgi:hypothetical protein